MNTRSIIIALATSLFVANGALALTETVDGITWTYTVSNGKVSVGSGSYNGDKAVPTATSGAITIPSTLGGYPVTSIGDYAFDSCSGLTSVTIPDSVTSIGEGAFRYCSYYDNDNHNYVGLTSVTIGNGVKKIGNGAFYECRTLESLTMGNSVQTIGAGAFATCWILTSFTIPASVTSIGEDAFEGCYTLFGSTGNPYGSDYKYGLLDGWIVGPDYLSDGTLCLENIRGIADGVFNGCEDLGKIVIRGTMPIIGQGAFDECPNLSCVRVENALPPHIFLEMGVTRFEVPEKIVEYMRALTDAEIVGIEGDGCSAIEIGRDWVSASAIRAENDFQINMSFDKLDLTESETTVTLRTFAQDGGETVTNFTFNSAITNGAILAVVLTDFDPDGCYGYDVSVSNSLFSGTHDFGCQVIPDEADVIWAAGSRMDSIWGCWLEGVNESSTSGVIKVWYGSDAMYEPGQPGEVGICMREDSSFDYSTWKWSYQSYWRRYILPDGAPGALYVPIPIITGFIEWEGEEWYYVDSWGKRVDNVSQWLREEQQYPLYYYHTWPAGEGVEDNRSSWKTSLVVPAWIKTHRVELYGDGNLFIDTVPNNWVFSVDDGDYFMRGFENPLHYQMDVTDATSSDNYFVTINVCDGYYIRRIDKLTYRTDDMMGWNGWITDSLIEYDCDGNIVSASYPPYDDNGVPLPVFGPVTEDVIYSFSSSPITYNITFVDELGANNPNPTTYTIEDCYDFLPPGEVDGWEFLGWDIDGVYYETGDITVTAQWQRRDSQVTFVVGAHGSRTGGGELEQTVVWGEAAVSPEIEAEYGWVFAGWDADISRVTESMSVTALYERAPLSIREATGLDKAWTTGGDAEWFTEWTEDAHDGTNHLHSGAIGDGQESWIETVVTNTGVVSFWWKASSEAYRGIAYDTLVFTVDGEIPESVPPIGGEVDWTNVTLVVEGDGPHALRWTYRKDASDSDGEDCAWLDDVQYLREVHVTFADGGATAGAAPDAITVGEGAEITLPDQSSLAWPKHRFIGWRTGDDVLAAGTAFALGYDDVAFTAEWEEKRVATPSIEVAAWYDTERTTVSMSCETAGATIHYTLDGSAPTAVSPAYTGQFSLAGSATVKAVAVLDDWFDSEVVSAVSVRAPWTPDECLNATGMVFRTGGDAEWGRDRAVAHDGDTAMRSGAIGDGQTSWIEVTVTGAGTLSFWWRASSESYKGTLYDLARLTVDGVSVIPDIGGEIGWRCESVSISGVGTHVVRWTYIKDSLNSSGGDCAWLDEVSWTPSVAMEPLPELAQDALPGDVAAVMAESADASLSANVTNAVQYAAFRAWALAVTNDMVTAQAVKESSLAWLSFALGADALIGKELTTDDVRIESFTPASAGGNYEITVSVKDVDIGGGAVNEDVLKENLKKVLGIEGARTLAPDSFSSDNIDITFGTPVDGKARIIVSPPPDAGSTFFMRVKVK